eukprot:TRINITY_DN3095_c1_g1_i1.p2 TRINITY_DN3095_c1_g1~~TRINITY_DN3095_c1_g1_i1.p2  ORF type:complete len:281 (+),score=92.74 TRINITY_DN3095_c1_g1_i1:77-844(+)
MAAPPAAGGCASPRGPSVGRSPRQDAAPCPPAAGAAPPAAPAAAAAGAEGIPRATWCMVIAVSLFGSLGDFLGPYIVGSHPLLLLVINANDLHCGLTAPAVPAALWWPLAAARRLSEDPFFFWIGWRHGDAARRWLLARGPLQGGALAQTEALIQRGCAFAVFSDPGMVVCCLAGASRMPLLHFAAANIVGTVMRLAVIRSLAELLPEQLEAVLQTVHRYQHLCAAAAAAVVLLGAWRMAAWHRRHREGLHSKAD